MKFHGGVWGGRGKPLLDLGRNSDHDPDSGISF